MGIKDIASGLMSKGQQTASDLGKRAGDLSGKAAMRAKISAAENEYGKLARDVGAAVFGQLKDDPRYAEQYADLFAKMDEVLARKAQLEKEYAAIGSDQAVEQAAAKVKKTAAAVGDGVGAAAAEVKEAAAGVRASADANGDGSVTADEVRAAVADKARAAAVAASGAAAAASGAAAAAFGKMRESLAKGEQVGEEIVVDEIVGESESGGDAGDGSVERDVEPVEEAAIEEEDRSE